MITSCMESRMEWMDTYVFHHARLSKIVVARLKMYEKRL